MYGSCLCGTVRLRYAETFDRMVHCHCSMCRKVHGAPYATCLIGNCDPFAWESGRDAVVTNEFSPGFARSFCGKCGTALLNQYLNERLGIPAGIVADFFEPPPAAHIYVANKAPWYPITDELPRHDYYAGDIRPAVRRATPEPSRDGRLRGSCLCGSVRYVMEGSFVAVHHCHCSRCRKARAAAHTTNGFTAIDKLSYTCGEDFLITYRVPEARYFAQTFCKRCGAGMPRHDPGRGIVVVPLGSLDDNPGRGADDHIFVDSMAHWDVITDSLPRFATMPI